jgi:hypothetical protein
MVCDDEAAACVPGPGCPEDAGPDAATPAADAGTPDAAPVVTVTGYGATSGSCTAAPPARTRSLLGSIF